MTEQPKQEIKERILILLIAVCIGLIIGSVIVAPLDSTANAFRDIVGAILGGLIIAEFIR